MLDNSLSVSSLRRRGAVAGIQAGLLGAARQQQLARHWDAAARQVSDSSILSVHGTYADNPVRLYADLAVGPDQASLRQQAAAETSASWASKRRLEIGIVTLVAVALTLLGLSLTVDEGVRRYLLWPAGSSSRAASSGSAGFSASRSRILPRPRSRPWPKVTASTTFVTSGGR
jgi:hypothetical protein